MKSMKSKRIIILTALFLFLAVVSSVVAQSLEDQLHYYDRQVYSQFTTRYPRDSRYDPYLNEIAGNLNSKIVDVFGEDKDIVFYACPSHLGFNAVSFYRVIIFDSLLLDSLRFLAMGKVYYGSDDSEYVDRLVQAVAETSSYHRMGMDTTDYRDINNPFDLPEVPALTAQQQQKAEKLFKSMLASWMCHEGSHCMLDHIKVRLQKMAQKQQQMYMQGDQRLFNQSVNMYMEAEISQKLEKEADVNATKWMIKSGYSIDGFIAWLKFAEKLEESMGVNNTYIRTHPKCSTRIQYIRDTARKYR